MAVQSHLSTQALAADLKDESVTDSEDPVNEERKRVACIGRPTSLTVANDLMPLGYDV